MSIEQKGTITNSSLREVILEERKTLNKKIIAYGTTAAISLGGVGLIGYKSPGVEERLAMELYRPPQTELSEAQQTIKTWNDQITLLDQCQTIWKADIEKCEGLGPENPVAPKMSIEKASDVTAQEKVFVKEAAEKRSTWGSRR